MITRTRIEQAVEEMVEEAVRLTLTGKAVNLSDRYRRFAEELLTEIIPPKRERPEALVLAMQAKVESALARVCPVCSALPDTPCVRIYTYPKHRNGKAMHATHRNRTGPYVDDAPPRPNQWMLELSSPQRDRLRSWLAEHQGIFER